MGLTLTSRAPTSPIDAYTFESSYASGEFKSKPAATGTVPCVNILVVNDAARTSGTMKGMSVNVEPITAVDAYTITGLEACVYGTTGSISSTTAMALYAEIQGFSGGVADLYGVYVYVAAGANTSGYSTLLRLEDGTGTSGWMDSFIEIVSPSGKGPTNLFEVQGGLPACISATGTVSVQTGRMTCKFNGTTFYIPLYTS